MKLELVVITRRAALLATLAALAGGSLSGCMSSSPIWDAHVGDAVRTVTRMQIIDPHAGENNPSTPGVDGVAAVAAQEQYAKSFQTPATTVNPFVIGIGSSGGSR
ncbi:hypothetical protein BTH42_29220 [Burkholderia sp. SRS-W-2-2016]|uniref:hypothetical protein n=1 Tax=Burkholderia sp. SRS-W-2-2016 TaxID=1926878 RepID=UPI00094AFE7B|nr:hypothetical protein [Burkholderia sp. SRS-W-2-2016]OLL28059.1 hypothetical protein BTH42_29220 [Burkholderia sp. SRS-W-2-2016]